MRGALTVLLAAAVGLSGCGSPEDRGRGAPLVAEVVCADGGARVGTAAVQPQADGVHLRLENREPTGRYVYYRVGEDIRSLTELPPGTSERVVAAEPGRWELVCVTPEAYPDDTSPWVALDVFDPRALWVPADVEGCEHPSSVHPDYVEYFEGGTPQGEARDPVELARELAPQEVPGWRPGDVIERAGYPEASPRLVRVVRDGRVVAVLDYRDDDRGGWYYGGVTYCEEDAGSGPEPGS